MAAGMRANAAWGTLSEDLLQINGRITGDALGSRRVIVRSVSDRILAAIDRPTMLVFDDLHWTDEMSLEVVGELARHAAGLPLFLVGAYRADEFPAGTIHREWRARLLGQRHAEEARLRRLTEAETASAITLILGGELPAPRDVVEAVLQRTNGIPLHVEELLAALPPAAFADGRLIRDAHVPDTIGDAILARFSRLSDDARLVARAGAVIGRCFSPDVLAGVLGRPLSDLEPTVQQLVDAAILYPFDFVDHGYYDFRHQLLRDAIYGDVPPSQLRRFHAHAAELVMGLESGSIIHASRHYERAGLRTEAYRAAMSGAVEASRIAAKQEALELYRRAIDNMPDDLPAGERAELFRAYAETGLAIERIDDALPAAREARRWFLHAGRTAEAAAMLVAIANGERKNGIASLEQRRSLIAQGLSEIEFAGSDPLVEGTRAQLLSFRSLTEFDAANFDEAARQNDGYLGIAKALGNHEMELDAEFMGGMIALARGEDEATLGRIVDIAHEARAAGYESVGVTSFRVAATMAARVMDYEAAAAAIGEGLEYADAIEQSHCRQQMAATSALVEWAHGDWDAASRRARQEAVERGCRRGALGAIPVIGFVAMGRGEVDEARHWLGDALAEAREIDDIEMVLPPLWGLAELALIIGEPAVAFARSEEALGIAQRTGERPLFVPFAVTGVRAALALHRPDDARRWLATCRGHLQGWTMAQAALHHGDGLVALAEGHLTVAHESLGAAADGWLHLGRVWERSTALLDQAQCLLRANRYAEATSLIAVVHEIAAALGSQPLLSRAQALKRLERGRGGLEERWYPLTAREFEVARRVTQGLTNPEIAEELKVTPRTISAHIEHILDKLDVGRRSEIAAWAASVAGPEPAVVQPDARGAHALAAVR
jgi:DNA-binding CsgD family transcriptional regulator